ncbi:PAS-domain containing protein [Glacieibacterium frigidum]|uniref:histidine kinase n=1 Tax=Glacieibacterium frigidum TaxID=2593303 RepID=A0A552UGI9_9SPHN|nr:PAS-domain containing protein [Glacieibacterium frigidum]TRW17348.1 response regulator [Glacieibacterium frigidum]
MNDLLPFVVALSYAAGLFAVAAWVDRRRHLGAEPRFRLPAYTLALAVYCTSWTFYGAVGSAAADGWSYLPIYLGPILVYLCAPGFLRRLIAAVQAEGATSISDFIGSRFGKSRGVAALVTALALFGTIPYLALQLRSVGTSYAEIVGTGGTLMPMTLTAIALALFAMLFGTRRFEASGRNEAILYAVAVESLVKLAALLAVCGFAIWLYGAAPPAAQVAGLARLRDNFDLGQLDGDFVVITLLAMTAIVCLPRQFYVGVIEARAPSDVSRSRFAFIGYLLITTIVVLPITLTGLTVLPADSVPDLFMLDLPLENGASLLAMVVFIGGFSAATGMVVVETIALSTMVSNDLIAPLLLRHRRLSAGADFGAALLWVRRAAIVIVMGAALAYALLIPASQRLASIGLVAFAAMAQFAPALLLAVQRPGGDAAAAKAGLTAGLVLWLYTLLWPTIAAPAMLVPLAGTLADPLALFGVTGFSPLTHGVLWSVGGNLAAFALVAARRVRAPALPLDLWRGPRIAEVRDIGGLLAMVERFVGAGVVRDAFGAAAVQPSAPVDRRSAQTAERLIASVIGAPSARAIMASALSGTTLKFADVARMLDESGQSLRFSKGLLAATLENIDPGVSVVDRDLNLVAWNSRYLDLFGYPPGLVYVGAPVAGLIRYNAERGECGPGEVEAHVERRLDHMRKGRAHSFERDRADGKVLKTVGGPMPGGGYVMCFTDVTAEKQAKRALEVANEQLEARVEARTRELRDARQVAEDATRDKTRFLAAASHDLLQPLHAARLFCAALDGGVDAAAQPLVANIDRSINAADRLLRALLDISKLDAGGVKPVPEVFAVAALIDELASEFAAQAADKGLRLRVGGREGTAFTDRTLLRSILQNFLGNALRYTASGSVLIGCRRRGDRLRIEVWDTGIGISAAQHAAVFEEFHRLAPSSGDEAGVGLGLAIVDRIARLLGARLDMRSVVGRGSMFAVEVPVALAPALAAVPPPADPRLPVGGTRVLCVDDDAAILAGVAALLTSWQCATTTARSHDEAAVAARAGIFDAAFVDYHLGDGRNGLDLLRVLRADHPDMRLALVTADPSPAVAAAASALGATVIRKPGDPAHLRRVLSGPVALAAE